MLRSHAAYQQTVDRAGRLTTNTDVHGRERDHKTSQLKIQRPPTNLFPRYPTADLA